MPFAVYPAGSKTTAGSFYFKRCSKKWRFLFRYLCLKVAILVTRNTIDACTVAFQNVVVPGIAINFNTCLILRICRIQKAEETLSGTPLPSQPERSCYPGYP